MGRTGEGMCKYFSSNTLKENSGCASHEHANIRRIEVFSQIYMHVFKVGKGVQFVHFLIVSEEKM